jgi:2,3-bisphosphoglycerate-dependent phosphoglycerate mutase
MCSCVHVTFKSCMKNLILLFFFVMQLQVYAQGEITTFILVRHAEKADDGRDPALSPVGVERAQRLASLLKNTDIAAVYSTRYKRTQNTVGPVAKEKNLIINDYESMTADVLKKLVSENSGRTILIAGHSNTIPQFANTLIGKSDFQNFADTEYGTILVIAVVEVGQTASVVKLSY